MPRGVPRLDEVTQFGNIPIAVQQQAVGGQIIPSGAPDFLVIAFDTLGQVIMNDETHVGFVDTHPKCDGCYNDLDIIPDKGFLVGVALGIIQPGVIRAYRISFGCQVTG